jgi:hypothetical protein
VDRKWDKGGDSTLTIGRIGVTSGDVTTGYSYKFYDGTEVVAAKCTSRTESSGFAIGGSSLGSSSSSFTCTCGEGEGASTLTVDHRDGGWSGLVRLPGGALEVTSLHDTDKSWPRSEPAGYRVARGAEPVGAVEVLHPGRIWLAKSFDGAARRRLGCLMVGAMLYVPPSSH